MQTFLLFLVAAILFYLYHKLFRVVYLSAAAFIREVVIVFLIAAFIVFGIGNAIMGKNPDGTPIPSDSGSKTSPSAQTSSGQTSDSYQAYLGTYYNLQSLEDTNSNTKFTVENSDAADGTIIVTGSYTPAGSISSEQIRATISQPQGSTYEFRNEEGGYTLTLKFHLDEHTLDVTQDTWYADTPAPFTGSYVDSDTWESLLAERDAAEQDNTLIS